MIAAIVSIPALRHGTELGCHHAFGFAKAGQLWCSDVVANDRHVLPADTGDVVDIVMAEDRHTASTGVNGQGGIAVGWNNALTAPQPGGGTHVRDCCTCFDKSVNAGLKHGHRYRVFLSCSLFDLLLCHSPCAMVSTR